MSSNLTLSANFNIESYNLEEMMTSQDYPSLVAQAEKAVAAVKDPDLKRIAFQKVLDDLLGSSSQGDRHQTSQNLKPRKKKASKGVRREPSRGPKTYIRQLIEDAFFKKPKTIAQLKAELENQGHHIPMTTLSGPLQTLCQSKELRRQKLKDGNKEIYAYSNW